jgi:predicted dehydrogenase
VKEVFDAGRLGVPGLLRIHRWKPGERGRERHGAAGAQDDAGTLVRRIVGEIDLACWMFNQRPETVYAVGCSQTGSSDYVQVHLGFKGGGMALIDYAETLPQGDGYFSISLIGSIGAAYADDHHDMQLLYKGGPPSALHTGDADAAALAQLQEFVNAVQERREPLSTGIDALRGIEVVETAALALRSRQAITLSQDQPMTRDK